MTKREKDEPLVPLTDAEAGAIQAVSEAETLRAFAAAGLTAHHGWHCDMAGGAYPMSPGECSDATCRQWARAVEGAAPTGRVFTEAEVREALKRRRSRADEEIAIHESAEAARGVASGRQDACEGIASDLGLTLD